MRPFKYDLIFLKNMLHNFYDNIRCHNDPSKRRKRQKSMMKFIILNRNVLSVCKKR